VEDHGGWAATGRAPPPASGMPLTGNNKQEKTSMNDSDVNQVCDQRILD